MDFKVIWSDEAIADLRGICSFIARDNPEAALRMGNGILNHVRILAQFHSLAQHIPKEPGGRYAKLSFTLTASSMTSPRSRVEWTSCMFGTRHAANRSCETPNLAHALDAARTLCLRSEERSAGSGLV